MPAKSGTAHRDVLESAGNVARPAEPHLPDLRELHSTPGSIEAPDRDLTALEPEGVIDAFAAGTRIGGNPVKEPFVGRIQIAERLLLRRLADGPDPVILGAQLGQFTRLRDIGDRSTRRLAKLAMERPALFERQIVDQPTNTGERHHLPRLRSRWIQPKTGATVHNHRLRISEQRTNIHSFST